MDPSVDNIVKGILLTQIQKMKTSLEFRRVPYFLSARAMIFNDLAERLNYAFTQEKLHYNFIIYNIDDGYKFDMIQGQVGYESFSKWSIQFGIWVFQQGAFTGMCDKVGFISGGYNRGCITGRKSDHEKNGQSVEITTIYFGVPSGGDGDK
ncbi:uncharacterized protein LOC110862390 isoform X2 [Folsomia candida]|uniref:Uncharacterized protein n=1 Tax=Folsomia candida TaxID=158441 RepID=A0A226CYK4_FOLCA|nr:uncharacterized protein LOC110862390 isoform X2 [Folsomia candida]OXA37618.1 hypothetical protein Fcan01_27625 [Folsomia candida]